MANKKDAAQQQNGVVDIDNISTVVRREGTASVEITKAVMENIKKTKDDRLKENIMTRSLRSEFQRRLKLLQLQKRRHENNITLKYLKEAEKLQYQMSGFLLNEEHITKMGGKDGKLEMEVITDYKDGNPVKEKKTFELKKGGEEVWVPGSITCPEYDDLSERMADAERKEKTALEKQYDIDKSNLESEYPGYFSYSWRW